jgi:adenylate kinase
LAERFEARLISTGDLFRWNVAGDTELGRLARSYLDSGELVPDEVVVQMVAEALDDDPNRFILDGFPRTTGQAEALERELAARGVPLTAALALLLEDEIAVKRIAGRRTCTACQRSSNIAFEPPKHEGVCDACGGRLVARSDDDEMTVRRRLDVYHESTAPLLDFYRERGLLREIDADGSEDEVTRRALEAIER